MTTCVSRDRSTLKHARQRYCTCNNTQVQAPRVGIFFSAGKGEGIYHTILDEGLYCHEAHSHWRCSATFVQRMQRKQSHLLSTLLLVHPPVHPSSSTSSLNLPSACFSPRRALIIRDTVAQQQDRPFKMQCKCSALQFEGNGGLQSNSHCFPLTDNTHSIPG